MCLSSGRCIDAECEGVTCPEGQRCEAGDCVGACEGVVCPHGRTCRGGACVDLCEGLTCDDCTVCVDGACAARCDLAACPSGEACLADGRCVEGACADVTCAAGAFCRAGECVDACEGAVCPDGQECRTGECVARDVPDAGTPPGRDAGPIAFDGGPRVDAGNGALDGGPDAGGATEAGGVRVPGGGGRWAHAGGARLRAARARGSAAPPPRLIRAPGAAGTSPWYAPRRSRGGRVDERRLLRQVIDINPHFIFVKDREGRFTLVNEATAEAYGTTVEQLLGKTDADFSPNPAEVERFRRDDLEVMDRRVEKHIEEVITDSRGRVRHLSTIKRPLIDDGGGCSHVLGVATDITALRHAEAERRALEAQVQHAQKLESLGILAGGIAHDFNNLLVGVLANADVALRKVGSGSPAAASLEQIRTAARRAADLCRQMLAYAGHAQLGGGAAVRDGGRRGAAHAPGGLHQQEGRAPDGAHGAAAAGGGRRHAGPAGPDEPHHERVGRPRGQRRNHHRRHWCDRAERGSAARRLHGGRAPAGPLRLRRGHRHGRRDGRRHDPAHLRSVLHDEVLGAGPRARGGARDRASAPRRHLREERAGSRHHHLGLPAGRIERAARRERRRGPRALPAPEAPRGGRRALVLTAVQEILSLEGIPVLTAADGVEGLAVFERGSCDIGGVLLDTTMPLKSGHEVLRELRAMRPDLPIVMMSGFEEAEARQRDDAEPPIGFLRKPFSADELLAAVRALRLDRR
ncbi:MAG: PAS domain-containing protein [Sandaracinaceae bacterium]|nr:PAS domain-containing protein [Sandaracinaceae bacterium]